MRVVFSLAPFFVHFFCKGVRFVFFVPFGPLL